MTKIYLKNSIIGVLIVIILFILVTTVLIFFKPDKNATILNTTISNNGTTFSLPKNLHVENLAISTDKNYKSYWIYDQEFPGVIGSNIYIYIPINNGESFKKLSDRIRPEFAQLILPIIINGHKGEFSTYHLNEQLLGDRPVQAQETTIYLNSNYSNAPIILYYIKYDGGNSLDDAWEMIIKTLKY